jgi:hypothetical protein
MHRALLGLIAAAAFTVPAQAQEFTASSFSASSGFGNVRFVAPAPPGSVVIGNGINRGHRRHIRVGDVLATNGLGYAGGYYDGGDYDANRSFDPDKWNDWWHDRPDRAFPRWVQHNEDCERVWYSGGGWRC